MDTNEINGVNTQTDQAQPVMFTPPTGMNPPEAEVPVLDSTGSMPTVPVNAGEVPTVESVPTVPAEPQPVRAPSMLGETTNLPVLGETAAIPVVEKTVEVPVENVEFKDDQSVVENEKLKSVEINYQPPSKAKTFFLILFFVLLIAFVIFLPDITSFIAIYKEKGLNYTPEEITTGKLKCTLDTNTTNLDKYYDLTFRYTDNQLESTYFVITTRGDATLDEATLDELAVSCRTLEKSVESISGISVQCSYSDGRLVETQKFELKDLDMDQVDEAFIEAGGNNPEYQYGQDIDRIERSMNASGYTCTREK